MDRIFNMATMPSRIKSLQDTVASILPQADQLNIYLNDFDTVPDFLKHPKINARLSKDVYGDLGDVGKFLFLEDIPDNAWMFTVDDKFTYPKDYAAYMISKLETYKRKIVVSLHGRIFFTDRPSNSYYFDCEWFFGCLQHWPDDKWAHEIGTGVMAVHSKLLTDFGCDLEIFKRINMTDIYFSMWAQRYKIPQLVAGHKQGYLKIILKHDDRYSIHAMNNTRDKIHTDTINAVKWEIHKPE
jgi:hypothetical protein